MKEVCDAVDDLIAYARAKLGLSARNETFVRNTVLDLVGLESYDGTGREYGGQTVSQLLRTLVDACAHAGLASAEQPERLTDSVMGALMLPPEAVEEAFAAHMALSSEEATQWLYSYSVLSDYVKKEKLDANPRFTADNGLIVTINRAKPEFRDPKKAVSGNSVKGGYPKCTICRENEGYFGRNKRTLRTVTLELGGEEWFWQFSPYGYFHEHGIAVNAKHTPMHVDRGTFVKLMEFVDLFPHYFIGCNAALPRIGGSVLAHDHFQGGGETLPLHRAGISVPLRHPDFPDVAAGVVDWYGTAVRLVGKDARSVADLAEIVRAAWCSYEDRARGIIAEDKDGVHSAVSPTVVRTERGYEMNLILRNNITSEQYPDGVFHAHPEFHVIKGVHRAHRGAGPVHSAGAPGRRARRSGSAARIGRGASRKIRGLRHGVRRNEGDGPRLYRTDGARGGQKGTCKRLRTHSRKYRRLQNSGGDGTVYDRKGRVCS